MSRYLAAMSAVLVSGCTIAAGDPGTVWIEWDPQDPVRLAELRRTLENQDELELLDWYPDNDPLSLVPDQRFRLAFPDIESTDVRWFHCQMGSTLSWIATLLFTPRRLSTSMASEKRVTCRDHDPENRRSLCVFSESPLHHFGDHEQSFWIDEEIDVAEGRRIMQLLSQGHYRDEAPGFDPLGLPGDWNEKTLGMRLTRAF